MSATFTYTVSTPDGQVAKGECDFLVVPTTGGELGVMADHAAIVACVAAGDLRISTGGAPASLIAVGTGLVDVRDNAVHLLVEKAAPSGG
jgi:F-type H+-transporting ATPase subunit epsilon